MMDLDVLRDPDIVTSIEIERIEKTVSAKGRTETTATPGTITASVQPATPEERETLPEADRVKETIAVWTEDDLAVKCRVAWAGGWYRVAAVERWTTPQGVYARALAVKEGVS